MVVAFTLKTVLTSIQYLLFLTLEGKETNFRGHKLARNKVQKKKQKNRESPNTCEKPFMQVPKNSKKFRKTRSRLSQENTKKGVEPIAPNSEAESKIKYTI